MDRRTSPPMASVNGRIQLARLVAATFLLLAVASSAMAEDVLQNGRITTGGVDCSVATTCVSRPYIFPARAGTIQVTGTWAGLLAFEGTVDGATWMPLNVTALAGSVGLGTAAPVVQTVGNGVWTFAVVLVGVRVHALTLGSGRAYVSIATW